MGRSDPNIYDAMMRPFLALFLDRNDPKRFFDATEVALVLRPELSRSGAYRFGQKMRELTLPIIQRWLDEEAMSIETLKGLLTQLFYAEDTKFFAHQGIVYSSVNVADNSARLRALDMGFRVQGGYAPDKHEVTGLDNLVDRLTKANRRVTGKED